MGMARMVAVPWKSDKDARVGNRYSDRDDLSE
jgi:hypothetical protein